MSKNNHTCDFCGEEPLSPLCHFIATWPRSKFLVGAEAHYYFCSQCLPEGLSDTQQEIRAGELMMEIIDRSDRDVETVSQPPGHA